MQEDPKYAVGIDVGTTSVKVVVGHVKYDNNVPNITVVGVAKEPTAGMRKGVVVNLDGPAQAVDVALGRVEEVSGHKIEDATLSINGAHILTTKADGMIAAGNIDHEITTEDTARLKEVATMGKIPANRKILTMIPHAYKLDGQDGIRNPLGMTGTRLEVSGHVVSSLAPYLDNLEKMAHGVQVQPNSIAVAGIAAAEAVLTESQKENGVALIDIGGSTTNVVVYEEGDLQFVGVIPIGGINITNDLAIGLKTDPEVAEKVKLEHASALKRKENTGVGMKDGEEVLTFQTKDIDEIVEARLDELFEHIQKELKKAGRAGRLPSGVVIVGGTAELKGLADYAKEYLGLASRIGVVPEYNGITEEYTTPEYASAFGLMLLDKDASGRATPISGGGAPAAARGFLSKFKKKIGL